MTPEFCFVSGVPGSSWSMLSHRLSLLLEHDLSDITESRQQDLPKISTVNGKMVSHFGSYFGPYNEFGEKFDDIPSNYNLESFYDECRRPFSEPHSNLTKCIRSHWFSYNLDWLWENCKGNGLFLIYKESKSSVNWWLERGGWDIEHPVYTWYENTERLTQQITEENNNLLDFASKKNLVWEPYTEEWWQSKFGKPETSHPYRPPRREYQFNKISVIYTIIG